MKSILPKRRSSAVARSLLVYLAATIASAFNLQAAADPNKELPSDVERLIKWLPEDTETVVVARSIILGDPAIPNIKKWSNIGIIAVMEGLNLARGKHLAPLSGRQVELAIRGSRNFDVVTSFGGLRSENCTIFSFAKDLDGSGKALMIDSLRKHADSVKLLVGREVFVFPSTISEEPWIKQPAWEGAYFVLLDPKTLLYATSDRYLAEVLERIDHLPKTRPLPDTLPEWKQVDLKSKAWILRHYPREDLATRAVGMTVACDDRQLRVVYTPRAGKEVDRDQVWYQWTLGRNLTREQLAKFRIERPGNGVVAFTATHPPDFEADGGLWLFQLLKLQAMDVAWAKSAKR